MSDILSMLIGAVIGLAIGFLILAIVTVLFRWLWNITMPDVFGLKSLTFWQAFRILLLSSILFGGGTRVLEQGHEIVPEDQAAEQVPG
jgi:succinate dehydrogenase hydrophobic anchor subunit